MRILSSETTVPQTVRIFLDDEEITKACFYAEAPDSSSVEGFGVVEMFVFDKDGVVNKVETKTGMVRWELMTAQ